LGSAECGDPAIARRWAGLLKASPKAGTLWRSLLKSTFGMIKTFIAVRARAERSETFEPKLHPLPAAHGGRDR
jgi:hypothetical protein